MPYLRNVFNAVLGRVSNRDLGATTYGNVPDWLKFKDAKDRKKQFEVYETGGLIGEAFDAYGLLCISPGYKVKATDERLQKDNEQFLESISFDNCAKTLITDALICSEGFQEKVRNRAGQILSLRRREPWTMRAIADKYGVVTEFHCFLTEKRTPDYIFKPSDIIYLNLPSLMVRAWDDIRRDTKVADAGTEAIVRHGFKKFHIRAGEPGETLPQTTLEKLGQKFETLKTQNEFVTCRDVDINNIDEGATGDVTNYSNFTLTRLSAALGVPEEVLGLGRGSTEATANVRLRVFYDKIGFYQRILARTYNNQLLKEWNKSNKVSITFNDVSPIDNEAKANYVYKVASVSPVDHFAVMSRDEMRAELGLPEDKGGVESEVIQDHP